jgi:manganese/zinc/iron transport system substrate-binding protein
MKLRTCLIALAVVWLGLGTELRAASKINVTATVGMVADMVKQVGGERVKVQGLMGPGVDPHLYKATAPDVAKLRRADVIFYNGLMLEGKMTEILLKLKRPKKHVYAVSDSVSKSKLLKPQEFEGHYDPHLWFDVALWSQCVDTVVKGLSAYSKSDASGFARRGAELKARLAKLHQWATNRVNELPKSKRILITSHDAYNYFGRAYGFRVIGLQGVSTVTEAGLKDMASMVDYIKKHGVKAIFVESSVSPAAIRRISQDAGVVIGGELFSDAMGTPGQMEHGYDVGTYQGMIRHNLNTIVDALK